MKVPIKLSFGKKIRFTLLIALKIGTHVKILFLHEYGFYLHSDRDVAVIK